jgi:GNAT superfamily N-acetyltransferase
MTSNATLDVLLEGYTDLPAGIMAAAVTYLEMIERPAPRAIPDRPDLRLKKVDGPTLADYRRLYKEIGEDLLWFSRAKMDDAALLAILTHPAVEVHVAYQGDRPVGLFELDARDGDGSDVELSFFGLVPDMVGGGAGRWLMNAGLDIAFSRPIRRLWLHTCHYDHPAALAFYRRSGFRPYKFAIELGTDPRLTGILPRTAAPQIPLIEPRP